MERVLATSEHMAVDYTHLSWGISGSDGMAKLSNWLELGATASSYEVIGLRLTVLSRAVPTQHA
ncbi:hypothetical protein CTAM01_16085 [Colletotrichum tamarilloi]|uniref:Uncharacterized protein n=1 Tax=Colletotrichum tamarilloi TaxID=1209934 RepID=A0ABQ9QJJ2_9PEZI|nr:uncharacterized protein CTAM01_16085 [Colletotrichum tamarilloi]KAI3548103.1 hypothetical protein CSPX01_03270 [Colletotrichum filicis]KAK1473847.1 hypothetical protein CTAM01_16085 [Colletotrichum tamarilloi]